jgi:hypothetical protein
MSLRARAALIVGTALAALVVIGCATGATAPSISQVVAAPSATSSAFCTESSNVAPSAAASRSPGTLGTLLPEATEIVVGTMTGSGPAVWDTPGGRDPTPEDLEAGSIGPEHRVFIDVERMLRGDAAGASKVVEWGGLIGCVMASPEDSIYMYPGERSVFFLARLTGFSNEAFVGSRGVWEVWPIDADGIVQACCSGPMSLDDLAAKIAAPTPIVVAPLGRSLSTCLPSRETCAGRR